MHAGQILSGQQAGKKSLGQVLSVMGTVAASACVGVERIPVSSAERFEGLSRDRRVVGTGGQHDAPVGGAKLASAGRGRIRMGTGAWHVVSLGHRIIRLAEESTAKNSPFGGIARQ